MSTPTHLSHHRSPIRRRLLAAGAAAAVAGVGLATWAGVSAASPKAPSHPATPSVPASRGGGGSVSPAVPGRPTVNPAVPSRPSSGQAVNPAVPSKPSSGQAVNPAVPSKPSSGPAVDPAVPGKPSLTSSVQVLRSDSEGELSIQMTVTNSTDQVWTFDSKDSVVAGGGHWGKRSPQTVVPGQGVTVTAYTDSPGDLMGWFVLLTYTIPDGHYATFETLTGLGPNSASGEWATSINTTFPSLIQPITACPTATSKVSGGFHPTSTISLNSCTAA
jgi:hypothetical protein